MADVLRAFGVPEAAIVTREQSPDARLTKLLGDGFICAHPSPELAVSAGARFIEGMRAPTTLEFTHLCTMVKQSLAKATTSAPRST